MTSGKKILMVIAQKDFRDEEYFIPLEIFRKAGIEVETVSSKLGHALGILGGEADIDRDIRTVSADGFDALVFVGGNGAQEYFEDEEAHRLVRDFESHGKVIAAICIAPVILAKAGVLDGEAATVWQSALDKTGPNALEAADCLIKDNPVVVSGNIITAKGREAAGEFAKMIISRIGD